MLSMHHRTTALILKWGNQQVGGKQFPVFADQRQFFGQMPVVSTDWLLSFLVLAYHFAESRHSLPCRMQKPSGARMLPIPLEARK